MKSKFDQDDFKFIYENKVLANSNHGYTDDQRYPSSVLVQILSSDDAYYISAPYKELFWTNIRVIHANNSPNY